MAKITTQIQDIDSSIITQVPAVVLLPKIAAPFTTVTKRAQCTDFSKDLLPRFGIDRVMTQAIQEVPVAVGQHKVDAYWASGSGTSTARTIARQLTVREI